MSTMLFEQTEKESKIGLSVHPPLKMQVHWMFMRLQLHVRFHLKD
jgi:hypothetical protein